jgi:hypothetical protein
LKSTFSSAIFRTSYGNAASKNPSVLPVSRVVTSAQAYEPGSPTFSNPSCVPGCQRLKKTPAGSWTLTIDPKSPTSMGSISRVPPASLTRAAVALTSGVARYRFQAGGVPSMPGICGESAPTRFPSDFACV